VGEGEALGVVLCVVLGLMSFAYLVLLASRTCLVVNV
jgi:hypothetical protein